VLILRRTIVLTLSWPAGHIYPTYKESFQVRWDNSIPLFLHAANYLEVSLFHWTSQNAFSHVQMILCAMLHSSIAHSIICTRLFHGKMHSDWFNRTEILQGRWQHTEKLGCCYPSGLEKTLCKWDIYGAAGQERVNESAIKRNPLWKVSFFFHASFRQSSTWQFTLTLPKFSDQMCNEWCLDSNQHHFRWQLVGIPVTRF